MRSNMTLTSLVECLASVEPVELEGMRLLKAHSGTGLMPQLPREKIKTAMIEIIEYTGRCQKTLGRLKKLTAIPLMVEQIGFAL